MSISAKSYQITRIRRLGGGSRMGVTAAGRAAGSGARNRNKETGGLRTASPCNRYQLPCGDCTRDGTRTWRSLPLVVVRAAGTVRQARAAFGEETREHLERYTGVECVKLLNQLGAQLPRAATGVCPFGCWQACGIAGAETFS